MLPEMLWICAGGGRLDVDFSADADLQLYWAQLIRMSMEACTASLEVQSSF
jgi:hypothetical protein